MIGTGGIVTRGNEVAFLYNDYVIPKKNVEEFRELLDKLNEDGVDFDSMVIETGSDEETVPDVQEPQEQE